MRTIKTQILKRDQIHIYSISRLYDFPEILLSESELQRAKKFKSEPDKNTYITGRSLLRKLIGSYLDLDGRDVKFELNNFGKPVISPLQNDKEILFNISHSGEMIAAAFCLYDEVGIDIEQIDPSIGHLEIAESFFSENECDYLKKITDNESMIGEFFRIWTRKEAVLKAAGTGLRQDLRMLEVLGGEILSGDGISNYRLIDLNIRNNYKAAVAYTGGTRQIFYEQLD